MTAIRMMFFTASAVISAGIWLSGWDQVHWLLYVPAVGLAFSGATGFCPGIYFYQKLGFKMTAS